MAAITLGLAVLPHRSTIAPILLLTAAGAATLIANLEPRVRALERRGERLAMMAVGAGLLAQFAVHVRFPPAVRLGEPEMVPFRAGMVLAVLLAGAALTNVDSLRRAAVPLMLVTHFLLGVWVITLGGPPYIDVFVFQRDGSEGLLRGLNPYAMTYPDLYRRGTSFYASGLIEDGRTTFGLPYPPLSLLLALPGQLVGDVRYAHLAAMTGAGALLAYARPGRVAAGAAALLLFAPPGFHVIHQSWTEPFVVLLFAATVFVAIRSRERLPLALGFLIAVKQYLVLLLPLVSLLAPGGGGTRAVWGIVWRAALIAVAITVPFVVWDVVAFYRSLIELQLLQPFRIDSISYSAWIAVTTGGFEVPTWAAFAAAALALALVLARGTRGPTGFAAGTALVFFAFFAFNKQAFMNYWFFVIGALCTALAASGAPESGRSSYVDGGATSSRDGRGLPPRPKGVAVHLLRALLDHLREASPRVSRCFRGARDGC